jgi:PAS domain S-box-containing protein
MITRYINISIIECLVVAVFLIWFAWRVEHRFRSVFWRFASFIDTGPSPAKFLGRGWPRAVHPDDRERCLTVWSNARAAGSPFEAEYRIRKADDSYRWYLGRAVPVSENGKVVKWLGTSTDIEDQSRAEHDHALLASIVESSEDAIIGKDLHGFITSWNAGAERLFGYSLAEAVGRPITFLLPPDHCDEEAMILSKLGRGERVEHFESVRETKDGRRVDVSLTISPIRDHGGRLVGISKIARDITERKQAEEAQRQSAERLESLSRRLIRAEEDERGRIARELHDEIGQALTAIKIHLQVVAQGLTEMPTARVRLDEALSLVGHTLGQVRSISLDLRPSLLDDFGLVAALRSLINRQARLAGFTPRFVPVADNLDFRLEPEIETACFRVTQEALTNIVRHAAARNVEVEIRLVEGVLSLVVRDDGAGFDPTSARRMASEGASLGLLGMQERVSLVGGLFAISSTLGAGTEVSAEFTSTPKAG